MYKFWMLNVTVKVDRKVVPVHNKGSNVLLTSAPAGGEQAYFPIHNC
jgi:hypothetical protein